jgi:hypothetical protein
MTRVLAPTARNADTCPVGRAVPGVFQRRDLQRRRGHHNRAMGDLPRVTRCLPPPTLARPG